MGRIGQQLEGGVDATVEALHHGQVLVDEQVRGSDLAGGLVLFDLQVGDRQRVGEVGVLGLLAALFKLREPGAGLPDFPLGPLVVRPEIVGRDALQPLGVRLDRANLVKVPLDGRLDALGTDVALQAAVLTAEAVEIRVLATTLAPGQHDAHPATAAGAAQHRLERVRVVLRALLGGAARTEQRLDGLEGLLVDERLMSAGVLDAAEGHHADVEAVPQHVVHLRLDRRAGGELRGRALGQTALDERFGQAADGVATLCERLERPTHVVGPLRVSDDGGDVLAVDGLTDVQVAERSLAGVATELGLLLHALLGFECQVAGVELGDSRHDAVQQGAARRLVDVLGGRNELCPGLLDRQHDLHVVGAVAGQPVDLVHDHQVDVALVAQPVEHGLELRPVGCPGRLPPVDVLLDDVGTEPIGRSLAGVGLGRDGEAVVAVVGGGLLGGRDAQIDHRPQSPGLGRLGVQFNDIAHDINSALSIFLESYQS